LCIWEKCDLAAVTEGHLTWQVGHTYFKGVATAVVIGCTAVHTRKCSLAFFCEHCDGIKMLHFVQVTERPPQASYLCFESKCRLRLCMMPVDRNVHCGTGQANRVSLGPQYLTSRAGLWLSPFPCPI